MPELSPDSTPASTAQTGLRPGDVIAGKYRIEGYLGAGGMGVVLSATHLDLDAPVAIKVVRDEFARNEEVVSRMLLEARAAAKLRGSHVVRVLDVARLESGAPYIVMERLEGSDLAGLLADRGAFPIQDAVDYLLQACEGLAEAHALGIIHRDLKPENLFLADTPEGSVLKILDFGISKDIGTSVRVGPRSALTNAGFAVGSPYYMSPEQMRASLTVDTRADVWSLGAILFELLTGKCPFEGETLPVVCSKVLNDEPPSLRQFSEQAPEQLDAILRCCLQKEADARFDNVGELAAALRDFASAEGQRSADRSARLASGINIKSERKGQPLTPVSDARVGVACSSPTIQAPLPATSLSSPARVSAELVSAGPPRHRRLWLVGSTAALVLAVVGAAAWSRASGLGTSASSKSSDSLAAAVLASQPPSTVSASGPEAQREPPPAAEAPQTGSAKVRDPSQPDLPQGSSPRAVRHPRRWVLPTAVTVGAVATAPTSSAVAESVHVVPAAPSASLAPRPKLPDAEDLGGRY